MQTFTFHVPANTKVTDVIGKRSIGQDTDFYVVADDKEGCYKLIDRFIGTRYNSFDTREISDQHIGDAETLNLEMLRVQRVTGSIKIEGAVEARRTADNSFVSLYVLATEGGKERVYFEDMDDTPGRFKTIAADLIAQF